MAGVAALHVPATVGKMGRLPKKEANEASGKCSTKYPNRLVACTPVIEAACTHARSLSASLLGMGNVAWQLEEDSMTEALVISSIFRLAGCHSN